MKKFSKISTMVVSAAVVLALGSGTALAAGLSNRVSHGAGAVLVNSDTSGDSVNVALAAATDEAGADLNEMPKSSEFIDEDEWEMIKIINPHIADEDWEIIKMLDNPEAYGGVYLGESVEYQNGQRVETKYYCEPTTRSLGETADSENKSDTDLKGSEASGKQSAADDEDEWAELKRINPQVTDEQWELSKRLEDPETYGLVLVSETERIEDGHLIVDSVYTDAAVPAFEVEGQKRFSGKSTVFKNDNRNDGEIMRIYAYATFEWKNYPPEEKFARVVSGSVNGYCIRKGEGRDLEIVVEYPDSDDDITYNFNRCAKASYNCVLKLAPQKTKTYSAEIIVTSYGEQVKGNE